MRINNRSYFVRFIGFPGKIKEKAGGFIATAQTNSAARITCKESGVIGEDVSSFCLEETLDSGQSFRWSPMSSHCWQGIAHGRKLIISRRQNQLILHNITLQEYQQIWKDYFDMDTDYRYIEMILATDPVLSHIMESIKGIRILKQDPFETLCSFIISQNNHIPRIKGIISRLCELYGTPLSGSGYAFPAPETLAGLTSDDLAPIRAGFRTKYILDAARKTYDGQVDLAGLQSMPLPDARLHLQQINGVGPKVAECVLLFGCGRHEAFPLDVWMKRIMDRFYPNGLPQLLRPYAGIAQQYLFHYARSTRLKNDFKK